MNEEEEQQLQLWEEQMTFQNQTGNGNLLLSSVFPEWLVKKNTVETRKEVLMRNSWAMMFVPSFRAAETTKNSFKLVLKSVAS